LVYLPGSGGAESGVNLVMAGARVRILNDERGHLAQLWPRGPKGNAWGNLWVDLSIGYAHAPTVDAGSHWAALEIGVGYEFSLLSPLQIGPYVSYRQVFVKRTYPAFLCIGISISFGYPKVFPKPKPRPRPRPRPRPNIRGRQGDRDGDTVGDGIDKCPSTPPGAQVDEDGCEYIRGRMIFPRIRFKRDSTELVPGAEFDLRRAAELIKAHPELKVEIGGHTETAGSFEDNLKLSLKRAQIVRDAVVRFGVKLDQVTVKGYGVSTPLVTQGSPEEKRKKNVRIEFRFSAGQPRPEPVRRPGAPAPRPDAPAPRPGAPAPPTTP
jgi:outer membrane protein OmpA-like peptidoglycan-associated protein